MKLISKKTEYIVENSNNKIKLTGSVVRDTDDNFITLNGSFTDIYDQYIGSFCYNYRVGNMVDRSISQIDRNNLEDAGALLDSTLDLLIDEFKLNEL